MYVGVDVGAVFHVQDDIWAIKPFSLRFGKKELKIVLIYEF